MKAFAGLLSIGFLLTVMNLFLAGCSHPSTHAELMGGAPGNYTATFKLSVADPALKNQTATLEVLDATTKQTLAKRLVAFSDFESLSTPQEFDLPFELQNADKIETRVSAFKYEAVKITSDRVNLGKLFSRRARFEHLVENNPILNPQEHFASTLVAHDGAWYAFNRVELPKVPGRCHINYMKSVVRKSTDRGKTWSAPVDVAAPSNDSTRSDGCAVTDGGAYYDSETNRWIYLAQCLGEKTGWNLCLYTAEGSSPMKAFMAHPNNPVVRGGQLFQKLCTGNAQCDPKTIDEGTVKFLSKSDGYFYVSYHGYVLSNRNGVRAMARTKDFLTWETEGPGLPRDIMLGKDDCNPWSANWHAGGCIGFGNASHIRAQGYNYIFTEASDVNLGCVGNQHWVLGMLRNKTFGPTGSWESLAPAPFVETEYKSSFGCELQYMNIFRDRGEIYMEFDYLRPVTNPAVHLFARQIYQLNAGGEPLKIIPEIAAAERLAK